MELRERNGLVNPSSHALLLTRSVISTQTEAPLRCMYRRFSEAEKKINPTKKKQSIGPQGWPSVSLQVHCNERLVASESASLHAGLGALVHVWSFGKEYSAKIL